MNFNRPTSEAELKGILDSAYDLARKSQYPQALQVCDWLIEDTRTAVSGYRERAAVKEHMNDIAGAIGDLQQVIALFDKEPADFHALGLLLLQNGDTAAAINAFDRAISLGDSNGSAYYANSSHLFRAIAHLKKTNFNDALADAEKLPIGYKTHVSGEGMRSREDLIAEAKRGLVKRVPRSK